MGNGITIEQRMKQALDGLRGGMESVAKDFQEKSHDIFAHTEKLLVEAMQKIKDLEAEVKGERHNSDLYRQSTLKAERHASELQDALDLERRAGARKDAALQVVRDTMNNVDGGVRMAENLDQNRPAFEPRPRIEDYPEGHPRRPLANASYADMAQRLERALRGEQPVRDIKRIPPIHAPRRPVEEQSDAIGKSTVNLDALEQEMMGETRKVREA